LLIGIIVLKYNKYLGIKHNYLETNCITLIDFIYKQELSCNIFDDLWSFLSLPKGQVLDNRTWMRRFSLELLEEWASKVAIKVNLTTTKEYDVIIFKSQRMLPIHFGMYIGMNRFIHVEEGSYSRIAVLDQFWRDRIANIWRVTGINTLEPPLDT